MPHNGYPDVYGHGQTVKTSGESLVDFGISRYLTERANLLGNYAKSRDQADQNTMLFIANLVEAGLRTNMKSIAKDELAQSLVCTTGINRAALVNALQTFYNVIKTRYFDAQPDKMSNMAVMFGVLHLQHTILRHDGIEDIHISDRLLSVKARFDLITQPELSKKIDSTRKKIYPCTWRRMDAYRK
jgi:hypothetical protein